MPISGSYDLCPKCGCAMNKGVCTFCGYKMPSVADKIEKITIDQVPERRADGEFSFSTTSDIYSTPSMDRGTYVNGQKIQNGETVVTEKTAYLHFKIPAIFLIILFTLFVAFIGFGVYLNVDSFFERKFTTADTTNAPGTSSQWTKTASVEPDARGWAYEGKLYDYFSMYSDALVYEEPATVTEADPYDFPNEQYYYFDNYVRTDVSYNLVKNTWSYANESGWFDDAGGKFPRDLYVYGEYYTLENTRTDCSKVNEILKDLSINCTDLYEFWDEPFEENTAEYIETYAYVSYMDEWVISIFYDIIGYYVTKLNTDDEEYTKIQRECKTIVIDLESGKVIDPSDCFKFDLKFAKDMIKACIKQNDSDVTEDFSATDLEKEFAEGNILWLVTTYGDEFGFNYPEFGGFETYTCTDSKPYQK